MYEQGAVAQVDVVVVADGRSDSGRRPCRKRRISRGSLWPSCDRLSERRSRACAPGAPHWSRPSRSRHGEHDSVIVNIAWGFGQPHPIAPYPLGATFGFHTSDGQQRRISGSQAISRSVARLPQPVRVNMSIWLAPCSLLLAPCWRWLLVPERSASHRGSRFSVSSGSSRRTEIRYSPRSRILASSPCSAG
jgi:hypothetical protein